MKKEKHYNVIVDKKGIFKKIYIYGIILKYMALLILF